MKSAILFVVNCLKKLDALILNNIYRIVMKAARASLRDCPLSPYLLAIQRNSCMEIRGMWRRQRELFWNQEMF